jgi:hypothetical protein
MSRKEKETWSSSSENSQPTGEIDISSLKCEKYKIVTVTNIKNR